MGRSRSLAYFAATLGRSVGGMLFAPSRSVSRCDAHRARRSRVFDRTSSSVKSVQADKVVLDSYHRLSIFSGQLAYSSSREDRASCRYSEKAALSVIAAESFSSLAADSVKGGAPVAMSRRRPAAIRETDHGSGFSDRVTETGHRRRAAGKGSFGGRAREAKIEGPQLRGDLRGRFAQKYVLFAHLLLASRSAAAYLGVSVRPFGSRPGRTMQTQRTEKGPTSCCDGS